jgi:hypothetical protein
MGNIRHEKIKHQPSDKLNAIIAELVKLDTPPLPVAPVPFPVAFYDNDRLFSTKKV